MLTLKDLMHPEGIQQVVAATGGTRSRYNQPQNAAGLAVVAQNAIQRNPALGDVKVRLVPNLPNAFYNADRGEILLGITNPAVLAHEIEHADNMKQNTLYSNMLRVAEGISRLNNVAAIPVMLALRAFIHDPERRDDILKTLAGLSAAVAAPGLTEETSATVRALQNNPGKRLELLRTLGPAYLMHMAHAAVPSLVYQAGRSS